MSKKVRTAVTIGLTIIEMIIYHRLAGENILDINNHFFIFISYATPTGCIFGLNYSVLAPLSIYIFMVLLRFMGYFKYINREFDKIAIRCAAWLADTKKHWGVIDTAEECQNANTCEGIIAMSKAGLKQRYSSVYKEALDEVFGNVTEKGLASKSLKCETVICTSMILYVYALEKADNENFDTQLNEKFKGIASNLWSAREPRRGWGAYVERAKDTDCSVANTFWALRALNNYNNINKDEYYQLVRNIYECATNSLFGYAMGDQPRLCTTAMSVILYYELEESIRRKIDEVYNVKDAINFVFNQFCVKGIECEQDELQGLEVKTGGVKKAPWTHITFAFSIEALTCAYKNKRLNIIKMNLLINRVKHICKKQLMYLSGNKNICYYIPKDMRTRNDGKFTFPTAYLIWGLSNFKIKDK